LSACGREGYPDRPKSGLTYESKIDN
jgi:hypothetical protein